MFFFKASTDEQVHCKWFITCWTVTGLPHTGTPCLPGILVPGKVRKHTNKGCPHKECDVLLTQVISASQVFITAMLHGRKRREKTVFRLRGWIVFFPPKWKILKKFSSHEKKRKKRQSPKFGWQRQNHDELVLLLPTLHFKCEHRLFHWKQRFRSTVLRIHLTPPTGGGFGNRGYNWSYFVVVVVHISLQCCQPPCWCILGHEELLCSFLVSIDGDRD